MRILTLAGPTHVAANWVVITSAQLHTHRGTTGKTDDDTRLGQAVDMVNRGLFEMTRQKWFKATSPDWDLVLDGPRDARHLSLPHTPVVGTLTTLQRGHYDSGGWVSDHTYTSGEFLLDAESGAVTALPPQPFSMGPASMRAVYSSGWAVLPADITWAALAWASVEYERASGLRHDITSSSFEGTSSGYNFDAIPVSVRRVIDRYTRRDQLF